MKPPIFKALLASIVPGAGHMFVGLNSEGWGWFWFTVLFYFLCLPIAVVLHFVCFASAAAEASQRPWLR